MGGIYPHCQGGGKFLIGSTDQREYDMWVIKEQDELSSFKQQTSEDQRDDAGWGWGGTAKSHLSTRVDST